MFQFYRRAYPAPNRSEADLLHNLTLEELEEWPLNYARNANKSTPVASAITTRKGNAPRRLASMRPNVRLSIGGEKFEGTARFLSDRSEHESAMAAIRRKYWMFRPIIEFGRLLTAVGLMRDNTGSFEVTLAG